MINPNTQAELRKKFNPEGSALRNIQLRMLDMLKYIDEVCQKNQIQYWLSSGTCLGAIRHGGFIPWDDDCDIELRRSDYKRLIKILKKESKNSQFKLQDMTTDSNYYLPFARLRDSKSHIKLEDSSTYKVNGCWIDIFPLERNRVGIMKICARIHNVLLNPNYNFHIHNKILERIFRFSFYKLLIPCVRGINKLTDERYLYHTYGICFYKKRFKEDFKHIKYVDFENIKLPVPENVDHYLKSLFGNYSELPSIEDQVAHNVQEVKFF